jgi:hypothetical protein
MPMRESGNWGHEMKHPSNRELFDYWNKRRGQRQVPTRADIEPSGIRNILGDTFVLEAGNNQSHRFRIAGTRLCALFGRELKAESFVMLWQRPWQMAIRELIAVSIEEKVGIVASATAATSDDTLAPVHLEMLLLPLASQSRGEAHVMGTLSPMETPYWLGAKAVSPLTLGVFRHIGAAAIEAPHFRAAGGRLRHGLAVYDGGRVD